MKFTQEHDELRRTVARFVETEINPYVDQWEDDEIFPAHELFRKMGDAGLLGLCKPEAYGGSGLDYSYSMVMTEELGAIKCGGVPMAIGVQTDMCSPALARFGSDALREEFLRPAVTGEAVGCIGVTEPGAGSDVAGIKTTARKDGDDYIINGAKTFITNGQHANLILVAAKTNPDEKAKGMSLVILETDGADGFTRGRKLEKIGMKSADTSELFFDNIPIPPENILGGEEGQGFYQMMKQLPQERLIIGCGAVGAMEGAVSRTIQYCKEREAFGGPLTQFQNTRFKLAEVKTKTTVSRAFLDECITEHLNGILTVEKAAMAKSP